MILAIEVLLTIWGCIMLFRGKGTGKDAIAHPHYRYLGGFLLTLLPVSFTIIFGFGVIWAITHQDQSPEELQDSLRWPATGVEAVIAITYATICHFWDKAIKSRSEREAASGQMPIA